MVLELVISDVHYGLPLEHVLEVALRVHVTPLAGVAEHVLGVVIYRGAPIPAVDLRRRLGAADAPSRRDDHMVVARTPRRTVALLVDRVGSVRDVEASAVHPSPIASPHVSGVVALGAELMLIHDLEAVLSLDEEAAVDRALAAAETAPPA